MKILGIETTCDETAAAVVCSDKTILSSILFTQMETHQKYGGVVPEVAARAHLEKIGDVVQRAMDEANLDFSDLSGVAVTAGPGLIGGVHVGVTMAKVIAAVHDLPFLAVNHLAAHALTVRLTENACFPYLLLLVSGGHTQLLVCEGPVSFRLLGSTIDDAVGEAFDKTARMLGLPYPGGPVIEMLARNGNPSRFNFPRPLVGARTNHSGFDFSFSGLKTAVRQTISGLSLEDQKTRQDIAASFQRAVEDILVDRCRHALDYCGRERINPHSLVVAGGVAANQSVCGALRNLAKDFSVQFLAPPVSLCTDNGAMVAWAGMEKLQMGLVDPLDFEPRPRWPLAELNKGQE